MSELNQTKSAFSKPENWVTWAFTAALIYGAGVLLYNGLPYLNTIIENMWYTVAAGGSLAVVLYVLANNDVHKLAWYAWKSGIRWITGKFIELDPIGIMRTYYESYQEKISEIKDAMAEMRKQIGLVSNNINDNNKQADNSFKMASQAKGMSHDNNDEMMGKSLLEARKANMLQESNNNLQAVLNMLQKNFNICKKMLDVAIFNSTDIENTIAIKSKERDAITATYKSMKGFKHLLEGDGQLEMFNMALEAQNNYYFEKFGEVEQFLDDQKDFMQTGELNKMAADSDAAAKLDAWEKKINNISTDKTRISSSISPTPALTQHSSGDFDDLLSLDDAPTKKVNTISN